MWSKILRFFSRNKRKNTNILIRGLSWKEMRKN